MTCRRSWSHGIVVCSFCLVSCKTLSFASSLFGRFQLQKSLIRAVLISRFSSILSSIDKYPLDTTVQLQSSHPSQGTNSKCPLTTLPARAPAPTSLPAVAAPRTRSSPAVPTEMATTTELVTMALMLPMTTLTTTPTRKCHIFTLKIFKAC
jgi:hypothetical protein